MNFRHRKGFVLVVAACLCFATVSLAEVLPLNLKIEKVLNNLADIGDFAVAPNGELWVLERTTGTIRVFSAGVEKSSLVVGVSTACESGLMDVAFAPDYNSGGPAFIYYVDPSSTIRVDRVNWSGGTLQLGPQILNLGTDSGGCRPGGGMQVGPDGLLYIGVGDLGVSGDAQNDASFSGKVLRSNLDGSVPAGNPSGTLVWAKGFRNGKDLAINPDTARTNGTVYVTDVGTGTTVYDEVNAVAAGGNYGWPNVDGPGGGYDDPLEALYDIVPEGIAALRGGELAGGATGSLAYACTSQDEIRQAFLTGPEMDQLDHAQSFYLPDGDRDGTPDSGCPHGFNAMSSSADRALYAGNNGTNPGIWRIYKDKPGPREVSAPGSPFHLTVDMDGGNLLVGWENLGTLDANFPSRNAGQHSTLYQVWEGTLPISGGVYDHTVLTDTNGLPDGPARLTASVTPGSGDRYYLVGAQGDNMEGTLGAGRTGRSDYCDTLGYGHLQNDCAEKWVDPTDPTQELYLKDLNPNSPTYQQMLTMSDFRGNVVRMDVSSEDCFWCNVQKGYIPPLDQSYRDRDLRVITVFTQYLAGITAYANEADCAAGAAAWAGANDQAPILCDVDLDSDGHGDVSWQYWHPAMPTDPVNDCGGTPQNFYADQGGVIYDFTCGAELSTTTMEAKIINEINPETCE